MVKYTLKNKKILKIRKPLETDFLNLIEYFNKVGGETDKLLFGKDYFKERRSKGIKLLNENLKVDITRVGFLEGEIVGYVTISKRNSNLCISVKREFWNLGIGTYLCRAALIEAREEGIEPIFLRVREDNLVAIALYKKLGFKYKDLYRDYFYVNGIYYNQVTMILGGKDDF